MVCSRCISAVERIFRELGHDPLSVSLGEVDLESEIDIDDLRTIDDKLKSVGFEIIEDEKRRIIEKIKTTVIEMVRYPGGGTGTNHSAVIESSLHKSYNYISNLFSSVTGITIEHYIILQKIEKAKELLTYNELTVSEIAYQLGYSSVAHLSGQFRKVTGLTPTHFKEIGADRRKTIDQIR